jgi:UDP-glucose 4-epimerase
VYGDDYPNVDCTGVRDYIHVVDVAEGHLAALAALNAPHTHHGAHVWNLGTGQGYSVLQVLRAFEVASGRQVPYSVALLRPGDIATCYANPVKAATELGWIAQRGLDEMMRDAWRWQQQNPNGYR